jgi:Na+-transporting methylmalonyl-CoA/oxaloacetate decarboxylase gamma subunit
MKKLFAIGMTLLLVFSLPLFVMAEEASTAPETSADTTAEAVTTSPETAENTTEESTEPESETDPEIRFGLYPETALVTLPIMGMGMLGIFLVTLVIILAVLVLSKIGKEKEEE